MCSWPLCRGQGGEHLQSSVLTALNITESDNRTELLHQLRGQSSGLKTHLTQCSAYTWKTRDMPDSPKVTELEAELRTWGTELWDQCSLPPQHVQVQGVRGTGRLQNLLKLSLNGHRN